MKFTNLLKKTLLAAGLLCVGVNGAWGVASTEIYDFTLSDHQGNFTYSSSHFDYSNKTWGYMVTNEWLNNRFSFADGTSSGTHRNYWQVRTFKTNNVNCTGLNYTQDTKRPLGIHNLKNGDVIIFYNTSAATVKLKALSTNLQKEGESAVVTAEEDLEYGAQYTVVTTDATTMAEIYGIQYCCVTSIKIITTEDETISAPTFTESVSGSDRIVTITNGVTNSFGSTVNTYYTIDGTNPTTNSTLYTGPITISSSCTLKAISVAVGGTISSISSTEIEAGSNLQLARPTITRTSATSVTITSDQSEVTGTPSATIHYTYGDENDTFVGSKVLTITEDATITAYATATGYSDSGSASLAVAPYPLVQLENVSRIAFTSGDLDNNQPITGNKTTYYPLVLDGNQWGNIVYFQPKDSQKGGWNFRGNNTWYNNSAGSAFCWMMIKGLNKGDVAIISILEAAKDTYNATYSEKYSYSGHYAYTANEDGDIELRFMRTDAKGNNVISGVEVYSSTISATIADSGYGTFASPYALDLTNLPQGVTAYKAASVNGTTVHFEALNQTVPANTGILLEGTASSTVNIPVATDGNTVSDNQFLVNTGGTTFTANDTDTYYYFGLMNGSTLTFGTFNPNTVAIPANKAYLKVLKSNFTSGARLSFSFGDDTTTGIGNVNVNHNDNKVYNLNGQLVNQPSKGLFIVNGKKVVIK